MHQQISIHAPRTGSDNGTSKTLNSSAYFNPRSPHGERRKVPPGDRRRPSFQSTLPARGATRLHPRSICRHRHFNPRSPHGERPAGAGHTSAPRIYFNPRSPHGERQNIGRHFYHSLKFQSTLPARGATPPPRRKAPCSHHFNPRSPHGERLCRRLPAPRGQYFNPRSPHGERRAPKRGKSWMALFQSTLPARGATFLSFGQRPA